MLRRIALIGILFGMMGSGVRATPELSEVWLGTQLYKKSGVDYVYGNERIQVAVLDINMAANPIGLSVQFTRNNVNYPWNTTLSKQPPQFEGLAPCPKSRLLNDFVNDLEQKKIQGNKEYKSEGIIAQLGKVKLIFRKSHLIRLFAYPGGSKWEVQDHKESHNSTINVLFGFEGDTAQDPKTPKSIYTLNHGESASLWAGMWYLDALYRLKSVKKVIWSRIKADDQQWATSNGVAQLTYEELRKGMEVDQCAALAITPPATYNNHPLNPADGKEKYFRLVSKENSNLGQFIFFDKGQAHQTTGEKWQLTQQTMIDNGNTVQLTDTNHLSHSLAVVQATTTVLPCVKLESPYLSGVQFVPNAAFVENMFYSLHQPEPIEGGFRQIWKDHPKMTSTVNINIVGVKENGQWKNLWAYQALKPAVVNGRLTMDISPHMQAFSLDSWNHVKNYLLIAYWLEGVEPVLKVTFPKDLSTDEDLDISKKISSVLQNANCIRTEFSSSIYLVKDNNDNWSARCAGYNDRNKNDNSVWYYVPFWQTLQPLLKEHGVKTLDFRNWTNPNLKHISDHVMTVDKVEIIYLTEFSRDKALELKLSDEEMLKMLAKTRGLKELKLAGIKGVDKVDINQILGQNAQTLKHVDLTGTEFPKVKEDEFVKIIASMPNLEVLKLIGFYLSNGNTEELAKYLTGHNKLKELHLALPYHPNTGLEVGLAVIDNEVIQPGREGGLLGYTAAVLNLPVALGKFLLSVPIMSAFEVVGSIPGSFATLNVLCFLSHIKSLDKVRLKVKGKINQNNCILKRTKDFRDAHGNGPLKVEFDE